MCSVISYDIKINDRASARPCFGLKFGLCGRVRNSVKVVYNEVQGHVQLCICIPNEAKRMRGLCSANVRPSIIMAVTPGADDVCLYVRLLLHDLSYCSKM